MTPTDKVSADVQNVPQTQTPTFDLSNDKTAEITSKKLVDPATGQPTDETTVTVAGEGSYTIDPTTGAVTFTPEKDFVGTAKGVTVQATATITNANGKTATITSDATYTPTVVPQVHQLMLLMVQLKSVLTLSIQLLVKSLSHRLINHTQV